MKYEQLAALFAKNADKERAKKMARYMRNQFLFYGIESPRRKALYKDWLKEERKKKTIDWALLDRCYADDHREMQYFVTDYLRRMQSHLVYEDVDRIMPYATTKQWWDTIDALDTIIGDIGRTDRRIDARMLAWSESDDFWLRRIAINHQRGRKDRTNPALLEEILVKNLGSHEFFINKAIGWSLREYSKTNPPWVRRFIHKYEEKMHPLSIREGSKYI